MKITIFGATGKTGINVVEKALESGHTVRAFVRTPSKLGDLKDKVTIIQGSINDSEEIKDAIDGSDCVVSVLGHGKGTPANMQTDAIKNIITAMNTSGVKRLIALTGAGVYAQGDKPTFLNNTVSAILKLVAKSVFEDGLNYTEEITKSDLNWTVLRAPVLLQRTQTNTAKLGMVGDSNLKFFLNRVDLAQKMIEIIDDQSTFKKLPYIAQAK